VIRLAISCDICGNEKRQTNHWFAVYEQAGELRLTGWNSRVRLRAGAKHLCGQICLHKLVDEFIARTTEVRSQTNAAATADMACTDTSLTSAAARGALRPAARQRTPAELPTAEPKAQPEVLAMPERPCTEKMILPEPRFASRSWRAEAWERERERELRAIERHPEIARRRSSA
jgi:hypothetical protein